MRFQISDRFHHADSPSLIEQNPFEIMLLSASLRRLIQSDRTGGLVWNRVFSSSTASSGSRPGLSEVDESEPGKRESSSSVPMNPSSSIASKIPPALHQHRLATLSHLVRASRSGHEKRMRQRPKRRNWYGRIDGESSPGVELELSESKRDSTREESPSLSTSDLHSHRPNDQHSSSFLRRRDRGQNEVRKRRRESGNGEMREESIISPSSGATFNNISLQTSENRSSGHVYRPVYGHAAPYTKNMYVTVDVERWKNVMNRIREEKPNIDEIVQKEKLKKKFSSEPSQHPQRLYVLNELNDPSEGETQGMQQIRKSGLTPIRILPSDIRRIRPPLDIPVPTLEHGLDRVLHEPGIHPLRDFRTNKWNFPPYLHKIRRPEELNMDALPPFVPPSQDVSLSKLALEHDCKYTGSTSSITGILSQFFFSLSNFRTVTYDHLNSFSSQPRRWTNATLKPVAFFVRPFLPKLEDNCLHSYPTGLPVGVDVLHREGPFMYSVDSNPYVGSAGNRILMELGKAMERMLTLSDQDYNKYIVKDVGRESPPYHEPQSFNYLKVFNTLLRSQLDCSHNSLPSGNNSFDLKTRATMAIRLDVSNFEENIDYRITKIRGFYNSFEREFFDMSRSAFLKYAFQARIGSMHGIFVTYHNIDEVFGFEYIPLLEIEERIFGSHQLAQKMFAYTSTLSDCMLTEMTRRHPGKVLNCIIYSQAPSDQNSKQCVHIWCEPLDPLLDPGWRESSDLFLSHDTTLLTMLRGILDGTRTFFHHEVDLATFVNGNLIHGPISYSPEDSLDVFWRFKDCGNTSQSQRLRQQCVSAYRRAHMEDMFDVGPDGTLIPVRWST